MRRAGLAAAALVLLTAGCGLPLAHGVQEPGPVPAEQRQGGDIQVLPPAPRDDASPEDIVRGFFSAQSSPTDGHASAREYLAPELRTKWRDTASVSVLAAEPVVDLLGPGLVHVTGDAIGEIASDGSYSPDRRPVDLQVGLRRLPSGRWVITSVPDGLLLSVADRDRSFRIRNVYFLAPAAGPGADPSHLVADPVFLPVTADSADALVRRLLAGPSTHLRDAVTSAFPPGTQVRLVRSDVGGLVTVDLSPQAGRASALAQEQMSAQLVWTLRETSADFSRLRLLSAGKPVGNVGGGDQAETRDRDSWPSYKPDGLSPNAPMYYVSNRRLRVIEPGAAPSAGASSRQVVDVAAASPRGGTLAFLTRTRRGTELRTGPSSGPFVLRAVAGSLASPSWGSGEQGVWFLEGSQLMLAPLSGRSVAVPVDGLGDRGPITAVRVSRDGVRVALIAGEGDSRRVLVGRVVGGTGALRVVGLTDVAPGVGNVSDLSWDSDTSLVVLGSLSGVAAPVQVAVDGSSVTLISRTGLEQSTPLTVAAAPDRPLTVGVVKDGVHRLYRDNGLIYVLQSAIVGERPFYPG